eukprot:scaffold653_cov379-Prasinococcus_capsulatus_cf.AAC.5
MLSSTYGARPTVESVWAFARGPLLEPVNGPRIAPASWGRTRASSLRDGLAWTLSPACLTPSLAAHEGVGLLARDTSRFISDRVTRRVGSCHTVSICNIRTHSSDTRVSQRDVLLTANKRDKTPETPHGRCCSTRIANAACDCDALSTTAVVLHTSGLYMCTAV